MSIIRVRKDTNYFTASNIPFNDKRLSWESRGLIGYLLSKPDHWETRIDDLEKQGPAKTHKLRRMLAELRKAGYMNRVRLTLDGGKFDWLTEVFEDPKQNPRRASSGGFSTSGLSTTGKPHDIVITDLVSTESNNGAKNIFEIYESNIGVLTPIIADTLKAAEAEYKIEWIVESIQLAVSHNKRNWAYCEAILKRWSKDGKDSGRPQRKTDETKPKYKTEKGLSPLEKYLMENQENGK